MAKRKKSKAGKTSSQGRKSSARKSAKGGPGATVDSAPSGRSGPHPLAPSKASAFLEPPFSDSNAALRPAPALPVSTRGKRERATRGGKPTMSTHELLKHVPAPPRPQSARKQEQNEALSQSQIYETLAALLVPYARKMESEMHPKIGFCLKAKSARTGRETHFGAVQALPDGVAFHLFPLYGHPDLLQDLSPDLLNRLRGKTCFHFEGLHAGLVAELAQLTHAGFERFLTDGVF